MISLTVVPEVRVGFFGILPSDIWWLFMSCSIALQKSSIKQNNDVISFFMAKILFITIEF